MDLQKCRGIGLAIVYHVQLLEVFDLILKLQNEELDSHKTALRTSAVMTRTLGKLTDKLIGTKYQNDEIPIIKTALDE